MTTNLSPTPYIFQLKSKPFFTCPKSYTIQAYVSQLDSYIHKPRGPVRGRGGGSKRLEIWSTQYKNDLPSNNSIIGENKGEKFDVVRRQSFFPLKLSANNKKPTEYIFFNKTSFQVQYIVCAVKCKVAIYIYIYSSRQKPNLAPYQHQSRDFLDLDSLGKNLHPLRRQYFLG